MEQTLVPPLDWSPRAELMYLPTPGGSPAPKAEHSGAELILAEIPRESPIRWAGVALA